MTIMVDGVRLSELKLNQVSKKVEDRMKGSFTYLTKMLKGLYSGDMNHDDDFQVLQNKIVAELIAASAKDASSDVKGIVKKEMISVAHQCGSQARMEQARIVRRYNGSAPEMDIYDEAIEIDLGRIEKGEVKVGEDTVISIDPKKLKEDITARIIEAEKKKIGVSKRQKRKTAKFNRSLVPEGASPDKKMKIVKDDRARLAKIRDQKKEAVTKKKGNGIKMKSSIVGVTKKKTTKKRGKK